MSFTQNMTVGQIREMVENPGTPIRQPATALFTIDTADRVRIDAAGRRIDTTTPNKVYINKQTTLVQGYFTRLALTELNLQWNVPNIIGTPGIYNNDSITLEILPGAPSLPITVIIRLFDPLVPQDEFLTPNELANALQLAIIQKATELGIAIGWDVGYVESRGGFFINAPDGITFRIIPKLPSQGRDLCTPMGLLFPSTDFSQGIRGSFAPMTYTPYFDIVSVELTKKQNVRDNSSSNFSGTNLLARIYLNQDDFTNRRDRTDPATQIADCPIVGTRPFTIYKSFTTPKQIYWDAKEFIGVIDLELRDAFGNILYSPQESSGTTLPGFTVCGNNANYQLTLAITET